MYTYKDLSKQQFLETNADAFDAELGYINSLLDAQYQGNARDVTKYDLWVLLNCEAGLSNGYVDPHYRHSEGERGLFPLPSNIKYWNGSDAPDWNRPMPLDVNIRQFLIYLGQLKNKVVTTRRGYSIYSGLFEVDGIADNPVIEARVLAGGVHGYFSNARYADRNAPIQVLLKSYSDEVSLFEMMKTTKYLHAGKELLRNRENNIEQAIRWLGV